MAMDRTVTGRGGEGLRWLLWPQLALVLLVSGLAYLDALPFRALLQWPGADKLAHAVLFGLLALTLDLWLRHRDLRLGRFRLPWAVVLLAGVAGIEEALQSLCAWRTADPLDFACDLAGMVLLVTAGRRWSRAGPARNARRATRPRRSPWSGRGADRRHWR
jgi:hypothetical protein